MNQTLQTQNAIIAASTANHAAVRSRHETLPGLACGPLLRRPYLACAYSLGFQWRCHVKSPAMSTLFFFTCHYGSGHPRSGQARLNFDVTGCAALRRAPLTQKLTVSQNTSKVPLSTMGALMDHLPVALPPRPSTTTAITPDTPAARRHYKLILPFTVVIQRNRK